MVLVTCKSYKMIHQHDDVKITRNPTQLHSFKYGQCDPVCGQISRTCARVDGSHVHIISRKGSGSNSTAPIPIRVNFLEFHSWKGIRGSSSGLWYHATAVVGNIIERPLSNHHQVLDRKKIWQCDYYLWPLLEPLGTWCCLTSPVNRF